MSSETRNTIMNAVDEAGKLPATVSKVLQLTMSHDASPKELATVIRLDPILSFQVLRLVNSALFGLRKKITSINQAVVMLGMNTIKNLALSLGLASKLKPQGGSGAEDTFNHEMFWQHSVSVGIAAMLIARVAKMPRSQQEEFFLAGLLHDVGKMVIFNADPTRYEDALKESKERMARLSDVEREQLGTDHKEVGEILARKWKLGGAILSGIIDAASHPEVEEEVRIMGRVVELGNDYAQRFGLGIKGEHHVPPDDTIYETLGIDREETDAFLEEKLPEEFARARSFLESLVTPSSAPDAVN